MSLPRKSSTGYHKIGPYSRRLSRGVIGDNIDGRTLLGRFCRDLEAQLIAHVGGKPSITHKILIGRIIKIHVQLDALDAKIASGVWTDHDARTYGGLQNALRLSLREIGLEARPTTTGPRDASAYLHGRRRNDEAAA